MEALLLYENITQFVYIKLSQASVLLPVVTGLIYFRHLNPAFKTILLFFIASIGFEVQASICKQLYGNNMPGLHLYTVVELHSFSYVFYLSFLKNKIAITILIVNTIIFAGIAIADAFVINGIWAPNTISRTYSSISLVGYSLIFFYRFFHANVRYYTWESSMFWLSVGILVYFSLNLFYFMLNRYLIENTPYTATLSLLSHAGINIIANILYSRSFLCFKRPIAI